MSVKQLDRFVSIRGPDRIVTFAFQELDQSLPRHRIVFGDEYPHDDSP